MNLEVLEYCQRCSLRSAEKAVVEGFGSGRTFHPLMIVGETADDEDELMGEPFSTLKPYLHQLLRKADLPTDWCYFTLGVKCPAKTPKSPEMWTCRDWLLEEIRVVKPKIVLALGRIPTSLLLNKKSIKLKDVFGQFIAVESTVVAPWYSLNHVYRSGKAIDLETISFLRRIKDELVAQKQTSRPCTSSS